MSYQLNQTNDDIETAIEVLQALEEEAFYEMNHLETEGKYREMHDSLMNSNMARDLKEVLENANGRPATTP